MNDIKLPAPKTCGCGIVHLVAPAAVRRYDERLEVYYWECACKSTLTYTPDRARTIALVRGQRAITV